VLDGIEFAALLAAEAFDSNAICTLIAERGAVAVIPSKADRNTPISYDAEMYKWRHLVESFFCKIKEFQRIATRYDKTDASCAAAINLVSTGLAAR
jgi:transposase